MNRKNVYTCLVLLLCMFAMSTWANGNNAAKEQELKMPALFGDGMVIQRDAKISVWGWAKTGEKVTVTLGNRKASAKAGKDGSWKVTLPEMPAGGPYTLSIQGKNATKSFSDVMLGDVFLFSGQSNQELMVYRCMDDAKVRELYNGYRNDMARVIKLTHQYNYVAPQKDCKTGGWQKLNPENGRNMAALSYLTAREIQEHTGVAVGIVNSSVGGTGVECWMSKGNLMQYPEYSNIFSHEKYNDPDWPQKRMDMENARAQEWEKTMEKNDVISREWRKEGYDFSKWREVDIFSSFYDKKKPNGSYWFYNCVYLTQDDISNAKNGKALLRLGAIKDADSVFVNGKYVGNTTYQYPPRNYSFDVSKLREGRNDIVIRLMSQNGTPAFVQDKEYQLELPGKTIPLYGKERKWRMAVGTTMVKRPGQTYFVGTPTGLYNAMIAPLGNIAIRGMVWYQGEANVGNPANYATYLKAMIEEWQKQFTTLSAAEKPWHSVIVQLAGFMDRHIGVYESGWCQLRSKQRAVTLPEMNTNASLVTAIDCGEYNDIHPQDKATVAHRIALQLFRNAYGENIVSEGPAPLSCKKSGQELIISFDSKTGKLRELNDGIAKVTGDYELTIDINAMNKSLSSTYSISNGVFRYAYDDFPLCTLYNTDNIAAPQFEIPIQ